MKLFGFDFSISKPAMCYYNTDTKEMEFYTWPASLDKKSFNNVSACDVHIYNRNLDTVSKGISSSELARIHTERSLESAIKIADDVFDLIKDTPLNEVHIASEGFSFMSKGNVMLDLSGYKYVLLSELYRRGVKNLYTYSPITGKNTAKRAMDPGKHAKFEYSKTFMIDAIKTTNPKQHKLINTLINNPEALRKGAANYSTTVDDLVDSYWILRTMCEREFNILEL